MHESAEAGTLDEVRTLVCTCGRTFTVDVPAFLRDNAALLETYLASLHCEICTARRDAEVYARREAEAEGRAMENRRDDLERSHLLQFRLEYSPDHPQANPDLFAFVSAHRDSSLWIAGRTGICKTRIVQYFARKAVLAGQSVLYFPAYYLLDLLSREDVARNVDAWLRDIYAADLLVLDDLGAEARSESKIRNIAKIIQSRYIGWDSFCRGKRNPRMGARIWITTNHSPEHIFSELPENDRFAVIRRLQDMCATWEKF